MNIKSLSLVASIIGGLTLLAACGDKNPPASSGDAVEEAPAPAPAVEPEPEPEEAAPPPPPPPPANNADLNLKMTMTDGTSVSGHVVRIERGEDWHADDGWTDEERKLKIEIESKGQLREVTWDEVASIGIRPGKIPSEVDCTYSSEFSPWMYTCELRTPTTVKLKDGSAWTANTRHKWHFVMEDGSEVEFYLTKHAARMQDGRVVTIDDAQGENYDMYTQLQDQLRQEIKTLPKALVFE